MKCKIRSLAKNEKTKEIRDLREAEERPSGQ